MIMYHKFLEDAKAKIVRFSPSSMLHGRSSIFDALKLELESRTPKFAYTSTIMMATTKVLSVPGSFVDRYNCPL